ncbi:hypothetical protein NL676_038943 [Syzygium grande]|nr:hypothetical protein NL676_038943 [Syzygium grande]
MCNASKLSRAQTQRANHRKRRRGRRHCPTTWPPVPSSSSGHQTSPSDATDQAPSAKPSSNLKSPVSSSPCLHIPPPHLLGVDPVPRPPASDNPASTIAKEPSRCCSVSHRQDPSSAGCSITETSFSDESTATPGFPSDDTDGTKHSQ